MKRFNQSNRESGFSLIEVTIVLFLSAIVLTALTSSLITIMKGSYSLNNYSDMVASAKKGRYQFTEDVGQSSEIMYSDSTNFIIWKPFSITAYQYPYNLSYWTKIEYEYDSVAKTLVRTQNDSIVTTLMRGVETLSFSYYTQVGNATVKRIDTKKIQMDATLERVNGLESNTYEVSTRCSMRNLSIGN